VTVSTPEFQIQNTPVLVNLLYVPLNGAPPPSPHLLGYGVGAVLEALLISPQTQTLLSTALDQLFTNSWTSPQLATGPGGLPIVLPPQQIIAQSQAQQVIQGVDSRIYGVSVNSPNQGTLLASTNGVNSFAFGNWGHIGTALQLRYSLPGWSASFKVSTRSILPDPSYILTFDVSVYIEIGVAPDPTVQFPISGYSVATNFQLNDDGLAASVYDAINSIAISLSGQPLFTIPPLPNYQASPIQVPSLFTSLSTAFTKAANYGFTTITVGINPNPPPGPPGGNTVEFVLIHPNDPGPQVSNALTPSGPTFLSPQIGLNSPVVPAGGTDLVTGTYFPAAQSSRLQIKWTRTISGLLDHSEVRWGATTARGVPPSQITDWTGQGNTFTATGLTPGTWYGFLVREFGPTGLITTGWSVPAVPPPPDPQPWDGIWTYLQTQATDQVELVLSYNNGTVVGYATLLTDGTFSATVTIPVAVPPGTYDLSAILSGQQMAPPVPITIITRGQTPPPILQILNPNTHQAAQGTAIVVGGSPVHLRGENFAPGVVELWVDASGGTSLGTVAADQNGSFTTQPSWPLDVIGPHNVLAVQGTQQAPPAPVHAESPAQ
jgi:hypothetical protein